MVQDNDDDIIELTQVVGEESSEDADQGIIELTDINTGDLDSGEADSQDDLVIAEPADSEVSLDIPVADSPAVNIPEDENLPDVTQSQLEAALERVIEKKFSETIEKILFEVMEKVIQKEVAEIRDALQKDLDDLGKS